MRDVCEEMSIFVCLVVVLFVNVCEQWACELEDVELLVGLVQDGDVGLEVGDEGWCRPPLPRDQADHCALRTFVCLYS